MTTQLEKTMKLNELKKMGFQKVGTILSIKSESDVKVGFVFEEGLTKEQHVYVWVDVTNPNDVIVLYCGRAGKGIRKRMYEHSQGFKGPDNGSESGKRKHEFLNALLNKGKSIEVWARVSKDAKSEEIQLIKQFAKMRNEWLVLNSIR
jgi:hypothetical protein